MPWSAAARAGLGATVRECADALHGCGARGDPDACNLYYAECHGQTSSAAALEQQIAAGEGGEEYVPVVRAAGPRCVKPTIGPLPSYYPPEDCAAGGAWPTAACVGRNAERMAANNTKNRNRNQLYQQALCEQANCLNNTNRDCEAEWPLEPVPSAPGVALAYTRDEGGFLQPVATAAAGNGNGAPAPVAAAPAAAAPEPDLRPLRLWPAADDSGPTPGAIAPAAGNGNGAVAPTGTPAAVASAMSWLTERSIAGLPNWLLVGAAAGALVLAKSR